jgi:hypothetical protein
MEVDRPQSLGWQSAHAIRTSFNLKPGHFQETVRQPTDSIVDYRDGTKAAVYSVQGVGWTYAGDIESRKDPAIVSMLGWPGPYSQYHAANAFEHWIVEMMLTRKEPDNAERLLLSTGSCPTTWNQTGRMAATLTSEAASRRRSWT